MVRQKVTPQTETGAKIYRLLNSIYYFLEFIYIMQESDRYRLVAIHHGKVYSDTTYFTLKGAKIAFTKYFAKMAWDENVKAKWSEDYQPEQKWFDVQLEILANGPRMIRSKTYHDYERFATYNS